MQLNELGNNPTSKLVKGKKTEKLIRDFKNNTKDQ
jgi:hypothetical protein